MCLSQKIPEARVDAVGTYSRIASAPNSAVRFMHADSQPKLKSRLPQAG
jgi:hypothetical protein